MIEINTVGLLPKFFQLTNLFLEVKIMITYMEMAKKNIRHKDFFIISEKENIPIDLIIEEVSEGRIAIIPNHAGEPVGLGNILKSKVLCNLGTSSKSPNIWNEINKAKIAVRHGASIICDLSVGNSIEKNRKLLIENLKVPIGSIPIYQNIEEAKNDKNDPFAFNDKDVLRIFEQQIKSGVTQPGIHTMNLDLSNFVKRSKRLIPIVSRGGSIMYEWINKNKLENPYFLYYDKVLEILQKYNLPVTFISAQRSGTIIDGFDEYQKKELDLIKPFIDEALKRNISVIYDGIGHMSLNQIGEAISYFKQKCNNIPLGVLGPAVTDRGLGHEHIVNAIGTAIAIWNGANYCNACYRTEHLGLPDETDIADGIGASIIAVYSGDIAKQNNNVESLLSEKRISIARKHNQWGKQLHCAIDEIMAKEIFMRVGVENKEGEGCSICGDLCPFVIIQN